MSDKIPNVDELKQITKTNYEKRSRLDLEKAVEKISELIRKRADGGFGFLKHDDSYVQPILKESPFVNWNKVALVFREAGYKLMGETNMIVWASEDELK